MGVFSRFRKGNSATSSRAQSRAAREGPQPVQTQPKRYEDAWARKEVGADEVQELLHMCTQELKSRALDTPFLLLPFRPQSDSNASKTFIRNFFRDSPSAPNPHYTGSSLLKELRIIEPMVLCSIMKWCWSRLEGGVVGWNTYELFRQGERESNMAKHSFDTFIPISVESEARKLIIFDFFELLAAIAANGKTNGLGGRKLSRLAGWWAFDHIDTDKGFDGGYQSWASAAAATAHLFFAYLRSLAPDNVVESTVSKLSRSLQALVAQTEYPPDTPMSLLSPTSKVVMVVSAVSPTPFALLRRAKTFDYEDDDSALQTFSDYNDPVQALTPECRRVLEAISSTNSASKAVPEFGAASPSPQDESWTKFEDMGFSSLLDGSDTNGHTRGSSQARPRRSGAPQRSGVRDLGRPATPSWADFMSSGFEDDDTTRAPTSLLLPPEQLLPPLSPGRAQSSQSHVKEMKEDSREPGELAGVTRHDMDETFWWVWMTSLAHEEPPSRKAVFGRCAFVETNISAGRWLVVEEQVKGASIVPQQAAMVRPKKNRFASFTKQGRRDRRMSMGGESPVPQIPYALAPQQSRTNIGPDQHAKVQAAAAALVQQRIDEEEEQTVGRRRGRSDEQDETKTQSVMTLGPLLAKEATPALQWARKFDKEATRQQYLGDNAAGKGLATGHSPSASTINLETALSAGDATDRARRHESLDKELPDTPPPNRGMTAAAFLSETSTPRAPTQDSWGAKPAAPAGSSMDAVRHILQNSTDTPSQPLQSSGMSDGSTYGNSPSVNDSPTVNRVSRKPIGGAAQEGSDSPSILSGPASMRPSMDQGPTTPKQSPAVMAARAATQGSPTSSKTEHNQLATRKASTKGFRGMFNKRNPETQQTLASQRTTNGSTLSVEKNPVGRTSSFLRRKQVSPTPPADAPAIPSIPSTAQMTSPASTPTPTPTSHIPSASDDAARIREEAARSRQTRHDSIDGGEPGPEETTNEPYSHNPPMDHDFEQPRAPYAQNTNGSSAQFSNFSQGPMDDVPAFVPDDEPVEPTDRAPSPPVRARSPDIRAPSPDQLMPTPTTPPVMPGSFTTRAAAFLAPERPAPSVPQVSKSETPTVTSSEFRTPMETLDTNPMDAERTSNATPAGSSTPVQEMTAERMPVTRPTVRPTVSSQRTRIIPDPEPEETAADRWAQIRKNAAERRAGGAQPQAGSQNVNQKLQAQSGVSEKSDDGETSGEESIESRVARIKARVAELTGSTPGNPGVAART